MRTAVTGNKVKFNGMAGGSARRAYRPQRPAPEMRALESARDEVGRSDQEAEKYEKVEQQTPTNGGLGNPLA